MRFVLSLLLFTVACTSSSLTEEYCQRADTCNVLITSVDECVERLDHALDQLPPSDQDEVKYEVQRCLDRPSCNGFASCARSLGDSSSRVVVEE